MKRCTTREEQQMDEESKQKCLEKKGILYL